MIYREIKQWMDEMVEGETRKFTYKDKEYEFGCFMTFSNGDKSFSVKLLVGYSAESMNVDKVTRKYLTLYSYNMMKQRISYKMSLDEMEYFI